MATQLQLGEITVDVVLKDIKNIHLSVYPPAGRVRISVPRRMSLDTIRVFAISKLGWIKQQQAGAGNAAGVPRPREPLCLGKTLPAYCYESETPSIELKHRRMILIARPGMDEEKKQEIVDAWYRDQVRKDLPALLAKWEPLIGVKVARVLIQRMKTKWGSCSKASGNIRLNTDLAKKTRDCLEYIVVHEMIHLLEPTHNAGFLKLMDRFMPNWRLRRDQLNQLPVRHEQWRY